MKTRMLQIAAVCLLCFQFIAGTAFGWWDGGHMLVAQIAKEQLEPEVLEKVEALLETFGDHYPNHTTMLTAATWLDYVRLTGGLAGFDRWHYTNTPFDPDGVLSEIEREKIIAASGASNVAFAINSAITTLKSSRSSNFEKSLMLNVLLHCVGDIHNPLHCTSRYTKEHPDGDRGGNLFRAGKKGEVNLHLFWDTGLGALPFPASPPSDDDLDTLEALANELTEAFPPEHFDKLKDLKPHHWASEGRSLAIEYVYDLEENQPIPDEYIEQGQRICLERITLAGYRLAAILNKLFK